MNIHQPVFVRAYPPATAIPGPTLWLPFREGELLVSENEHGVSLIRGDQNSLAGDGQFAPLYLGHLDSVPCLAVEITTEDILPEEWRPISIRALFGAVPEIEFLLAGFASEMLHWQKTSGFCPVCGHATEPRENDWGRCCPNCGHISYPHVTPAVLILVHDGDKILLAHKAGWGPRYSILAGFVEPGESLEDCVRREILEEVSVTVSELAYVGSQPWPFPHQLMIGFTARYAEGAIKVDDDELDAAQWFTADSLPELPPPVSLSRQMIDAWTLAQRQEK